MMTDLFGQQFEEEIRALWWKQPYASLMLHGKIETRTWDTSYRGLVLICSSMQPYNSAMIEHLSGSWRMDEIEPILDNEPTAHLHGYAIALGRLSQSRRMRTPDANKAFVKWREDLYSHIYTDVRRIIPFPLRGHQGWWKIDKETRGKIMLTV